MFSFSVLDKFARGYSLNPIGLRDEKFMYDAFTPFQNLALFYVGVRKLPEAYLAVLQSSNMCYLCKQFSNIWWAEGNL